MDTTYYFLMKKLHMKNVTTQSLGFFSAQIKFFIENKKFCTRDYCEKFSKETVPLENGYYDELDFI
jgi:hypothetical protein